ncbi:MAG: efflux RND transporter permease subunit [Myxococcota bacterium]
MNLSQTAIRYNRVTAMIASMIALAGAATYFGLPRDSMPPFTARICTIVTQFPGASPERVESLVTDPIERVAQELADLDYIASTSRTGVSMVRVDLTDDVPESRLQSVWDELRRKLDDLQLPDGVRGPSVEDEDVGVVYPIFVGVSSDGFSPRETYTYAERLRDELIVLPDAARVRLGGVAEERVFIDYDEAALAKLGLSATQIQGVISAANIVIPAGEVNLGVRRIILEPSGSFESVEQLRELQIPVGAESVTLGEIADVRRGYETPRDEIVRVNGDPGIGLYVALKEGANIIDLGRDIDHVLHEFDKALPVGVTASRLTSQDYVVESRISVFMVNVMQAVVIVMLVVLVFLGARPGVTVAAIIPATVLATFTLMELFGTGLNQVTLAGLIMALGLLVDNGIVVVEGMLERLHAGDTYFEAAGRVYQEFKTPLLISSLTTSSAFLCFYLAESVLGEIMGNLFVVITMALLSSWIMAFAAVPLIGSGLLGDRTHRQSPFDRFLSTYEGMLRFCLARSSVVYSGVVVGFFAALYGFTFIPFVFMPDSDRNLVTLEMNLPLGTQIETTDAAMRKVETYLRDEMLVSPDRGRGVTDWSSYVGVGPESFDQGYYPGEADSAYAIALINTSSFEDNRMVIDELERFALESLPDAQVTVKMLGSSGGAAIPIEVRLSGPSPDGLYRIAEAVKAKLRGIPGTKNIDDDWGPKQLKLVVEIDSAKLIATGLTNEDVARSLSAVLSGRQVGEYREGSDTIPITLQAAGAMSISAADLETIAVFSQNTGQSVSLVQVARVVEDWQYSRLRRRGLRPTLSVNSFLKPDVTATEVTRVLRPWLEEQANQWPADYSFELGGESESSSRAMDAVIDKMPISIFLMVSLLVLQFNSFRKTFIIVMTIPLGFIGVVFGLLVSGNNFSFTGFLGVISLAGIIINDAIVLLDTVRLRMLEGASPEEALVSGAKNRFSPILLTTFTTSFGMIPLWISGGEMWRPMAVSMIFGLLFATLILLFFVPNLYQTLFRTQTASIGWSAGET